MKVNPTEFKWKVRVPFPRGDSMSRLVWHTLPHTLAPGCIVNSTCSPCPPAGCYEKCHAMMSVKRMLWECPYIHYPGPISKYFLHLPYCISLHLCFFWRGGGGMFQSKLQTSVHFSLTTSLIRILNFYNVLFFRGKINIKWNVHPSCIFGQMCNWNSYPT